MPKHPVNARVMNFRAAVQACGNGQFLPLTAEVQQPQDVVEDGMQTQFGCRTATPHDQVRQDKLFELRQAQLRGNPLPLLALPHFDRQSDRILAYGMPPPKNASRLRVSDKFDCRKNAQPVV